MTKSLFCDTDAVLDLLLRRGAGSSSNVDDFWGLIERRLIQPSLTSMGLSKIYDWTSTLKDSSVAARIEGGIQLLFSIHNVTDDILRRARHLPISDHDSAVEVVCAIDEEKTAILTHHPENFKGINLRLMSIDDVIRDHLDRMTSFNTTNFEPLHSLHFRGSSSSVVPGERLDLGSHDVVYLSIYKSPNSDREIDVEVQLLATNNHSFLPSGITLTLCDLDGIALMEACSSGSTSAIVLSFSGEPEEAFSIQILWKNISIPRTYII
jgi:Protein of unknown function (DUF1822)